ncbi:DMT family transporter [Methylophaga sp. UBA4204]|jgi:drug/metabolite transporter (DMT)-like permease|nr:MULTISPECIES: EamA family transporter [unclassified Methylophaga]MAL49920.1 EamA family transporter [Methylophaga sp.]MBP24795.1 EamA family transporter [Methylophaga sp.]|tara:strand:+ start:20496 stop:21416 length:921 start_codon:yes stop_codon:yes gene_type:complete
MSSNKHVSPGTLFVVLAAMCWGLAGGIGGILTAEGWSSLVVSFYRGIIGLLFVFLWLILRPNNSGLANWRLWFWSVIAGVGVAGNFAFYFRSIAEGSVAVAVTLMYCAPVFVFLISFAFKLERASLFKWCAMAMVIMGVMLLTGLYDIDTDDVTPVAAGAGLLSGLSYAIFIFGFKYAVPHGSPQAILFIAFGVLVSILIGFVDIEQTVSVLSSPNWFLFVLLGVLGAGISFILYIVGLKYTAPTLVAIVAMVEPVTASLFGIVVLDENLSALQFFGMGLIIVTVTVLSRYTSSQNEPSETGDQPT